MSQYSNLIKMRITAGPHEGREIEHKVAGKLVAYYLPVVPPDYVRVPGYEFARYVPCGIDAQGVVELVPEASQ